MCKNTLTFYEATDFMITKDQIVELLREGNLNISFNIKHDTWGYSGDVDVVSGEIDLTLTYERDTLLENIE